MPFLAALPLLATLLFLGLTLYQYDLPGLYYDEAFDAVPAMQPVLSQDVELGHGRVAPQEIYGPRYETGIEFAGAVATALQDRQAVFIAHTETDSNVPHLDAFRQLAAAAGFQIHLERTFHELSGRPVYYVLHDTPARSALSP